MTMPVPTPAGRAAGPAQENQVEHVEEPIVIQHPTPQCSPQPSDAYDPPQNVNRPPFPVRPPPIPLRPTEPTPPPPVFPGDELENLYRQEMPSCQRTPIVIKFDLADSSRRAPAEPREPNEVQEPACPRQSFTFRRVRSAQAGGPQRHARPGNAESEEYNNRQWRKFKMQQHQDYMELRRESNRIREMEILNERGWQTLGMRAVDLLCNYLNK